MFVREGSVVPVDEGDGVVLEVFAPRDGGEGGGALYWDDGDGDGRWRLDRFALTRRGSRLSLSRQFEGDGPGPRALTVRAGDTLVDLGDGASVEVEVTGRLL